MMRICLIYFITFVLLLTLADSALSAERFPPPDFVDTDHQLPVAIQPPPQTIAHEYLDLAVLLVALSLATFLTLKNRRRRWLFCLMVFSLIYFGFWRKGCVCPIGAIQNVTLSLFDPDYAIPLTTLLIFLLPLVFTLFFGRAFCGAVCPLGAIQDVVLIRPITLPSWLEPALGLLGYVYLAGAILFAATSSAFIICQYDPFVSFFRLSGSLNLLILGASFLLMGLFLGRPYCRFLCPYGVILRNLARLSKWFVTITPDKCIQCKLCEDSCPYAAIQTPNPGESPQDLPSAKKRLLLTALLLPLLVILGAGLGRSLAPAFSRLHDTVRQAERVYLEEAGQFTDTTDASDAFWASGATIPELYQQALAIRKRFNLASVLFGGFLGLVLGAKLISLSITPKRTNYEADRGRCLACGRCFAYCPVEKLRLAPAPDGKSKPTLKNSNL